MKYFKYKSLKYYGSWKGSPRPAVCPFCFKAFYDKSTMNRHVSKKVCLGLNFKSPNFIEDVSEISMSPAESPVLSPSSPVSIPSELSCSKESETQLSSDGKKTTKIPCPYCKKPMKGVRGVRKHLDFYGCPMAFSSDPEK